MLLRLALGALAVGMGALLPALPAGAVAGCEDLVLVTRDEGVVRATVPASLGRLSLPAVAFSAVRNGREVPVQARRLQPSEVAVSLLLAGSSDTTAGELAAAQAAMLDLLVSLPTGVRTSLVVGGDPARRVSPLSADRGALVQALSRLDLIGATDPGAGSLALQQLPPQIAGHLVVVTDGRLPVLVPSRIGTQVHRLDYGSDQAPPAASGCPSGADLALLPAADAVVQRVQGSYELVVPDGSTQIRLRVGAQRLSAPLGAGRGTRPPVEPEAASPSERDETAGPVRPALLTIAFLLPFLATVLLVKRRKAVARDGPLPAAPRLDGACPPPAGGSASPGLLAVFREQLRRLGDDAPSDVDPPAGLPRPRTAVPAPGVPGPVVPGPVVPGLSPVLRAGGADATTFVTVYVVLLVCLPARLVFAPLGAAGTPAQLLGIAGAGWWLWHQCARRQSFAPRVAPVRRAMLLFCASVLGSFIAATLRPIDAVELSTGTMGLLSLLSWLGVLLVAHDGITDRQRLDTLLRRLTLSAGLVALLGLMQFATGKAFTDLIQVPGLSVSTPLFGVAERDGLPRPAGTALSPIEFGVFLSMTLPLAIHYAVQDAHRGHGLVRRWFPVVALSAAIPLCISRSALLGTVVVLAFLAPTWTRSMRRVTALAIALVLSAGFVVVPGLLGSLIKLFTGISNDNSATSRTDSYPLAWEFIVRDPLLGRGFLTFLPKYRILDNQYLLQLVDTGVVGLLCLLVVLGTGVVVGLRMRYQLTDAADRDLALCLSAGIASGAASFAFFDALSFPMVAGAVFLQIGAVGALSRTTIETPPDTVGAQPAPVHAGAS